ncbi:hypothetical protein AB0D59_48035 [Streptomyces sp. NPDC048417]|uniref:hypothetical protein n=1 Tax=Streptomyces sp. NPDC048417 TaxID=3155387 RepID=UPI00344A01DD
MITGTRRLGRASFAARRQLVNARAKATASRAPSSGQVRAVEGEQFNELGSVEARDVASCGAEPRCPARDTPA